MDILINGNAVDALSCIVHVDKAVQSGRTLCAKLKDVIPRYSTATHKCVVLISILIPIESNADFLTKQQPQYFSF